MIQNSYVFVFSFTATNTWTKKKLPSEKCRFAHSANAIGPWMFIFGGSDGTSFLGDLDFLNLSE